mgnify:CR=1 FL=1
MKKLITKKNIIFGGAIIFLILVVSYVLLNKQENIIDDEEVPNSFGTIMVSDAGLIANDSEQALENSNKLIKALNKYKSIIIDDTYYISTPTEKLTTREVEIIGTDQAELISADNEYTILFDPADVDTLILKNVKFTNYNTEESFLIVYPESKANSFVERVYVEGCTFRGNISLYRQYGDTSADPDKVKYGVEQFYFMNNKVYDTNLGFIILVDVPVKYCEISGNTINNFKRIFLNISISNEENYSYKLYKHIDYLKVDSNNVYCDDAWWDEASSGYYVFVLFEGREVLYHNNYVEGMKAINNIELYDAYLSSDIVNYTNNTWKNNICFHPNKTNNILLMSKGGGSDNLVRNYSHNTFIVEADFAERIGQSKDNLYVDFMLLTHHADSYKITDNTFDIYDLRFMSSSASISNFFFNNNKIKAKYVSGNMVSVRMKDAYFINSIEVKDNIIEVTNSSNAAFNLVNVVDNRKENINIINKVHILNNKITAPFGYILYGVLTEEMIFSNNIITDIGTQYSGFAFGGMFINSTISNNSIESINAISFFEGRQLYGAGIKNEEINILRMSKSSGSNGMYLDTEYHATVPTQYKRVYQIETSEGIYEFYFNFTIRYNKNTGFAEVTFENSDGKLNTYRLDKNNFINDGNGQFIKTINTGDSKNPFNVRFFNGNGNAIFYITNFNNDINKVIIKTTSLQLQN